MLLNAQRLRRLKRDRERQTPRWTNFENRVNTVADSPERGFELALYYAVTGDEERGKEAVKWSTAHVCDTRQAALVSNWTGALRDGSAFVHGAEAPCVGVNKPAVAELRDRVFAAIAHGQPCDLDWGRKAVRLLREGAYRDPKELYAGAELLYAMKTATRTDLREEAPEFFAALPTLLLLGLKPQQAEHPDWVTHIAALALVELDPNGHGSQFLQGWALEERQMLHDGPGVAYEFFWADPYLPGVGYQNLDPWAFDADTGTLVARTDWSPASCWIRIAPEGIESQQCPAGWQRQPMTFGGLQLLPMAGKCIDLPRQQPQHTVIVSKLTAGQKIRYDDSGKEGQTGQALSTGLWRVPGNASGRVCAIR